MKIKPTFKTMGFILQVMGIFEWVSEMLDCENKGEQRKLRLKHKKDTTD